jgi:hypothetical protein
MELKPEELTSCLFSDLDNNIPCVIYMGTGTHFNKYEKDTWDFNLNQQFPAFLHDFKLANITVPIKIILFDKACTIPYIVTDNISFFSNTFVKNNYFSNVYSSEFGITVYNFSINVTWLNDEYYNNNENLDITNIICEIIKKVNNSNHLFFFHDFAGRNPQNLEFEMENMVELNKNKICIDISRGRDLSCCVNFNEPENYPLIKIKNNKILWLNPDMVGQSKCLKVKNKFKQTAINIECPYNNKNTFDYFIFRQVLNKNKIIYEKCKSLIDLMRIIYHNCFISYSEEKIVRDLKFIFSKIQKIKIIHDELLELFKLKLEDDIVEIIVKKIKEIIELFFSNIDPFIEKYEYETLFLMLDTTDNKYQLINIFVDFAKKHEIIT